VRSRNSEDDGQPLRMASRDVVGNLVGTWKLSLRELKPEYIGLLVEAVDYLDAHSEFELQLGGARNFGAGMVDARVINPLYTDAEIKRVYNRAQDATSGMAYKDDLWRESVRQQFVKPLQERVNGDVGSRDGPSVTQRASISGERTDTTSTNCAAASTDQDVTRCSTSRSTTQSHDRRIEMRRC